MTRHRIAQIGENRNPKSQENRSRTRCFLQIRLLQARRSAALLNRSAGSSRTTSDVQLQMVAHAADHPQPEQG
jgi:hypothetical protein